MIKEQLRLEQANSRLKHWKRWGPYLSERAWGTVREDYSATGEAWDYFPHDHARSRAYRWNEDGIAGISDRRQALCFALALWNEKDPILKERMFGLTGSEGNHGEDVKEYYFYLDSTPTHSYMKYLYKYPHAEFPYQKLLDEIGVGKCRVRVFVKESHVRVRRRRIEVEVVLLDVLAVVAFAVRQAEQALLDDGVLAVPECQRETEHAARVADAAEAVLAPAVSPVARLVMAEVVPCVAVGAVVLANGAPLPVAEVRPPFLPWVVICLSLCQPLSFCAHVVAPHIELASKRPRARHVVAPWWATHCEDRASPKLTAIPGISGQTPPAGNANSQARYQRETRHSESDVLHLALVTLAAMAPFVHRS